MMRLTKTKLQGIRLPDLPMLGRGNTSIIFDNGNTIIGYTVEQIKMEWLMRGLGLIDTYDYVGEARYEGYYIRSFTVEYIDVYRYEMPKLEIIGARNRGIKAAQKIVNETRYQGMTSGQYSPLNHWLTLSMSKYDCLSIPANFVLDYDADNIYPDYGSGDWAMVDGEPVCIDPFHHKNVHKCLQLTR